MMEYKVALLSGLAGATISAVLSLFATWLHHRHDLGKERRAVAREKKEAAIASAERVTLSLKRVHRIHCTRQQESSKVANDKVAPANHKEETLTYELNLMQVQARAEMEESLLTLRTLCNAYFPDDDLAKPLAKLEEDARDAYASAHSRGSLAAFLGPVKLSVTKLNEALRIQANKYKG